MTEPPEIASNQLDFDAILEQERQGVAEGRRRQDSGIERATSTASQSDIDTLDELIENWINARVPFSANSIREEAEAAQIKSSLIGGRFRAAVNRGVIKRIGDTPSSDPATHAHRIGLYVAAHVSAEGRTA